MPDLRFVLGYVYCQFDELPDRGAGLEPAGQWLATLTGSGLSARSINSRTIRVIAPQGFHFGDLPPGGDENGGEFGRAHLEFARDAKDPRAVIIKRSVVFDQSVIPVEKYAAWRAWVQRVDGLMHKGVRLLGGSDARPPEAGQKPLSAKGAK